jgi:SAM-dependent methyltransferase
VVTAVDFSPGMLDEARRKTGPAEVLFLEHNLQLPLPLADRTFDLVVSGLVLEHLSNLPAFFGEVRRILSDGGRAVISAMHPAMFLRNSQARFTDPASGEVIAPGSINHSLSGMIMSAFRSGFHVDDVSEHAPDPAFAQRYPRAEKYIGWPMLVVIEMRTR